MWATPILECVSPLTTGRAGPILGETLVLALLVLSGLIPATLLIISLAVPLSLVLTFAGLNALFSSAVGPRRPGEDLAARGLPLLAYLLLGASLALALEDPPHWSAWYALAFALVVVFARLWRNSVRDGALFPHGYLPALMETVAIGAGLATYMYVDRWRDVLPALVVLALRAAGEVWWELRHPVESVSPATPAPR